MSEAIALAAQQRAQLTILTVVDFYVGISDMQMANEGLFERHLQAMRDEGHAILEHAAAQATFAGVRARVLLREAKSARPAETIVEEASHGYDLLVMGTHGRRGWQRLRLGSQAEEVLRGASVPVLLVRSEAGAG